MNIFSYWTHACADTMLDEVIFRARSQFPQSFHNETTAKIYFFVLINRQLLFRDEFESKFIGNSMDERREFFAPKLVAQQALWKEPINKLPIPLGSEVVFLMQGVAHVPEDVYQPWKVPLVESNRESIGLAPHGGNSAGGGGVCKDDTASKAQERMGTLLTGYGVPSEHVPKIP